VEQTSVPASLETLASLRALLMGSPVEAGREWLQRCHIRTAAGVGWAHFSDQDFPSVWGGTLDGIMALASTGTSAFDPMISDSIDWIFSQQRDDGGFGSREMNYSAAESTAWVLVALFAASVSPNDPRVVKAHDFLVGCIKEDGAVGTSPSDKGGRIYPALLTAWALSSLNPTKAKIVANRLRAVRTGASGGWGYMEGGTPVVGITAQVVFALIRAKLVDNHDSIVREAVDFIVSHSSSSGTYPNSSETWFSSHQPNIPLRYNCHTQSWVVRALSEVGFQQSKAPLSDIVAQLVSSQSPNEGYWIYDPSENTKHVWCVAGAVLALDSARRGLLKLASENLNFGASEPISLPSPGQSFIRTTLSRLAKHRQDLLITAIIVYLFTDWIVDKTSRLQNWLGVQSDSIMANLVSSVIWAFSAIVVGFAVSKFKGPTDRK
jgi:hypothetical protein